MRAVRMDASTVVLASLPADSPSSPSVRSPEASATAAAVASVPPAAAVAAAQPQSLESSVEEACCIQGAPPAPHPADASERLVDEKRVSRLLVGNLLRKCGYQAGSPNPATGGTLRQWLSQRRQTVDRVQSLYIFYQVLQVMEQEHCKGNVIRHLNPSLIELSPSHRATFKSVSKLPEGSLPSIETSYCSPEELAGQSVTSMSNMYSAGVLFFELICPAQSDADWVRLMGELRYRIVPPALLRSFHKEVTLVLWLLHPEPTSRPTAFAVLNGDLIRSIEPQLKERQQLLDVEEREEECEVLREFLQHMHMQKVKQIEAIKRDIAFLSADMAEIERRKAALQAAKRARASNSEPQPLGKRRKLQDGTSTASSSHLDLKDPQAAHISRNFKQLEAAYFEGIYRRLQQQSSHHGGSKQQFRQRLSHSSRSSDSDYVRTLTATSGGQSHSLVGDASGFSLQDGGFDRLGAFSEDLRKFSKHTSLEVRAALKHGDLLNSANMVCSIGFDRDEEYFATAGVCRRIKIFDYKSVVSERVDIHYPVLEMSTRAKLASLCWNSYIKSHVASSDYEGVVQLWDATVGTSLMELSEHSKRVWSVDFSRVDPTRLASASDDGRVKIWSISQESSCATIEGKANLCCVNFAPDSTNVVAFGSADYKVFVYDLRCLGRPLSVLGGHQKAVSYVKWLDGHTLVSASTDNTLKLWDVHKASMEGHVECERTFTGHTNEKNFVGLAANSDGYIACGSESNGVFVYYKSLPMPVTSYRFRNADPVTGLETEDDAGQFVSSVCFKGNSSLVAANSLGNIKILDLV
eukprot:jgi/Chlat1/9032/Chrsp94S08300